MVGSSGGRRFMAGSLGGQAGQVGKVLKLSSLQAGLSPPPPSSNPPKKHVTKRQAVMWQVCGKVCVSDGGRGNPKLPRQPSLLFSLSSLSQLQASKAKSAKSSSTPLMPPSNTIINKWHASQDKLKEKETKCVHV